MHAYNVLLLLKQQQSLQSERTCGHKRACIDDNHKSNGQLFAPCPRRPANRHLKTSVFPTPKVSLPREEETTREASFVK